MQQLLRGRIPAQERLHVPQETCDVWEVVTVWFTVYRKHHDISCDKRFRLERCLNAATLAPGLSVSPCPFWKVEKVDPCCWYQSPGGLL